MQENLTKTQPKAVPKPQPIQQVSTVQDNVIQRAMSSQNLNYNDVMSLQKAVGNQAVANLMGSNKKPSKERINSIVQRKIDNMKQPIQRVPVRTTGGGWIKYKIVPGDLGTGSDTNSAMRTWVNDNTALDLRKGDKIDLKYEVKDNNDSTTHQQATISDIDNTQTTFWHAGHILANQNGGDGTTKDNIFRQDPALNTGAVGLFDDWRKHEDKFNTEMGKANIKEGTWSVKVHN